MPHKDPEARRKCTRDRQRGLRKRAKEFINAYKNSQICAICDENSYSALDFHHIDLAEKDFSISQIHKHLTSLDSIKRELEKCVPLCANCHRKVHAGELMIIAQTRPSAQQNFA